MKGSSFALRPFSRANTPAGISIAGIAQRSAGKFSIQYEVRGPTSEFIIPPLAKLPARKNRLWEETCFEFFLAPKDSGRYWEFNLSPSGHWNVYRFASYRREMQEDYSFTSLPFSVQLRSESLAVSLEADISKVSGKDHSLDAGIAAIMVLADGTLTYWALGHPGRKPDFHWREAFILEL